jgi:hypothetical protein
VRGCFISFLNNTVNPVYKGYSREPENVPFMSSCPLYEEETEETDAAKKEDEDAEKQKKEKKKRKRKESQEQPQIDYAHQVELTVLDAVENLEERVASASLQVKVSLF